MGNHDVTIKVTDSLGNTTEQVVRIVARTTNAAPLLLPVGNQLIAEGVAMQVQVTAIDLDGDVLTYTATGLPPGAKLDAASGLLTWTPGMFQAGRYDGIVISASDGHSTVTETIAIVVANTNRAPLLASLPPLGTREGRILQFSLTANDVDADLILYGISGYSLNGVRQTGQVPAGVFFNAKLGTFEWTPGYEQAGQYVFTLTATDALGATDSIDVTVNVQSCTQQQQQQQQAAAAAAAAARCPWASCALL